MLSPRYFLTWMGVGLLYLASLFPIKFQLFLGKILGLILYSLSSERKKIVEINLKLCFPNKTEEERKEMVKEVFKDMGRGLIETGIAWWRSDKFIEELITKKSNFELLDDVNEGCLILLKHSTHAELDIRMTSSLVKAGGMYKNQTNKVMNYLMIKARNKYLIGTVTNRQTRRGLKFLNGQSIDFHRLWVALLPPHRQDVLGHRQAGDDFPFHGVNHHPGNLDDFMALFHINERLGWLVAAIAGENLAVGFASVVFVAYLSAIVNPRYAAVQYALMASLTMLIGTLGRGALGELVEERGFAYVFIVTALLGLVAVVASVAEALRTRFMRKPEPAPVSADR